MWLREGSTSRCLLLWHPEVPPQALSHYLKQAAGGGWQSIPGRDRAGGAGREGGGQGGGGGMSLR